MSDLRKIDALIAEHVMGWELSAPGSQFYIVGASPDDRHHWKKIPAYSTDIALAIGVLEKATKNGLWGVKRIGKNHSIALDDTSKPWSVYGCPLPEAICRHVLHVLGYKIG